MDLEFRVVEERVKIRNWLGLMSFFYGYLIEKESEVLGF